MSSHRVAAGECGWRCPKSPVAIHTGLRWALPIGGSLSTSGGLCPHGRDDAALVALEER